jgi:Fe-S-cluster containining protein
MNIIEEDGYDYKFDSSACVACGGHCCVGESGYIWVKYQDIINIADLLDMNIEDFATSYIKKVKHRYSLIERYREEQDDYACIFFDDEKRGCSIYSVRPAQCRSFPFWEQFKCNKDEVKRECIGILEN